MVARIGRRRDPSRCVTVERMHRPHQRLARIECGARKEALAIQIVVVPQRRVLMIGTHLEHRAARSSTLQYNNMRQQRMYKCNTKLLEHQLQIDRLGAAHPRVEAHGVVAHRRDQRPQSIRGHVFDDVRRALDVDVRRHGHLATVALLGVATRHDASHHVAGHQCAIGEAELEGVPAENIIVMINSRLFC